MNLSVVERSVIISALNEQIASDQKEAEANPALAGYVEHNIQFRQELIAKIGASDAPLVEPLTYVGVMKTTLDFLDRKGITNEQDAEEKRV